MTTLYFTLFLILGLVFGSFFNVVGGRLPEGKSIIYPPSHCDNCGHNLSALELIPVLSYLFQGGKCKKCKKKISIFHPLFELFSGIIFALTYLKYGLTLEIIIPLTFISMLLIIIVSDIYYMIIPDEVLIFFGIVLILEVIFISGFKVLYLNFFNGLLSFIFMFLLKICGDYIFKQESMGGGDIKLLFFFGFCTNFSSAILSIFYGAIIGLPISLILLKVKKTNIIPFGPFLSLGIIIILLTGIDINTILNVLA